jgi:serine/threonine-protein kinase
MASTERLPSPRPHDPEDGSREDRPRVSGDVLNTDGEEAPDPTGELIGKVIGGRYRIESLLGRGGMGVVYRAMHLELDQAVAIKILPTSYARDGETLKRFEREARTASRVRHPNVVTVFDLGRLDTGEPYLVMELLDGKDLDQVMRDRGTLPLKEVVEIMMPIATAIDALHVEGVVHRDIKPSNIFFTKTKAMGEIVKLVDFGLAALHSAEGTERLTRVGHVVGTAVYMAPEAARGALSGPAGDTYALAVVAYEMLTGLAPFDGAPMAVLLDKVQNVAPTLSAISGSKYDDAVEAAFTVALARDPNRRPKTAVAFVEMLRRALQQGAVMPRAGVRSRPPPKGDTAPSEQRRTTDERAALPVQRTPWAAIAVALLLVIGLAGGWLAFGRTPPPPTSAPHPIATRVPEPLPIAPPPTAPPTTVAGIEPPPTEASTATDHGRTRPRTTTAPPPSASAAPPPTSTVAVAPPPTTVAPPPSPPPTEAASEASSTDRSADLLRDAQAAMLHGQIANARDLYQEATQSSPRNTAAWRGLGLASERLGLAPEARRAYERYLELAPDARDATTIRERLTRLSQ